MPTTCRTRVQDLALAVVEVLRDHGAVEIEVDGVEGRSLREVFAEHGGHALESVARHVGARFGRTPQGGHQLLSRGARRLHEACDRDIEPREGIEHCRTSGQARPGVVLEEVLEGRTHGREGVGLVLKARDGDSHGSAGGGC